MHGWGGCFVAAGREEQSPISVKATATAGSTSVTVTAGSSGLQLSTPDGKASCTGFGVAWRQGMPEGSSPCTISFNRSSAHLGGTQVGRQSRF